MKRQIAILLFAVFYYSTALAQKDIPSFNKIEKADLDMKDCDFDQGAEAIKLIDICNVSYDRGTDGITFLKTVYEKRVRIKILKDKGLSYANVEIPYYDHNRDERIIHIDAHTFNLDEAGKIIETDVSKSSIYTKKINRRYSRLIIAFPEAKVGSVIEYRYRLERESYAHIDDWYFQDAIPTRYSECEVKIPRLFVFNVQRSVTEKMDETRKEFDDVINIGSDAFKFKTLQQNFVMHNLIGIKEEPFMASAKDYQQHLNFQLTQIDWGNNRIENLRSTWTNVVASLGKDDDFGQQLKKDVSDANPLVLQAVQIADKNERIKFIYNSIRSKIRCNDKEAIYTDAGVINTWQKGVGNIADINLLLVNILNKADIKAQPVLLSTRDNGLINASYPSTSQFNVVMAYVKTANGFYVLDATDKLSNYKLTPARIVNTSGFIVDGDYGKFEDIIDNAHNYQLIVAIKGDIDDKGLMTGDCSIKSVDYARKDRIESYTKDPDNFKQQYFIKPYPSLDIKEISLKNADVDSLAFNQKISFTTSLNNSGGYSYFNTNLFAEFEKNPFVEDHRNTDIDYGYQQSYTIYGNFTIPDGYVYETLPEDVSMSMPDKTIQYVRTMQASDRILNMKVTIDFKSSYYLIAGYPDFHEFYKKLMTSLNEQVVFKKK